MYTLVCIAFQSPPVAVSVTEIECFTFSMSVSNYAKRMARLSARIFGEVSRPTSERSMKVVKLYEAKPLQLNGEIARYYPRHIELTSLMKRLRFLGLFR